MKIQLPLSCGFAILIGGACSPSVRDYKETVKDGIGKVPHVQEIVQLFPNAPKDQMILEFGIYKNRPVTWDTEVFFGGKYVLSYQVDVEVDYSKNQVLRTISAPKFHLIRVAKVYNNGPSDTTVGAEDSEDHKFYEKDWEKVVAAKGDFSVIGIKIDTNSDIPKFDEYIKAWRMSRVHVE